MPLFLLSTTQELVDLLVESMVFITIMKAPWMPSTMSLRPNILILANQFVWIALPVLKESTQDILFYQLSAIKRSLELYSLLLQTIFLNVIHLQSRSKDQMHPTAHYFTKTPVGHWSIMVQQVLMRIWILAEESMELNRIFSIQYLTEVIDYWLPHEEVQAIQFNMLKVESWVMLYLD